MGWPEQQPFRREATTKPLDRRGLMHVGQVLPGAQLLEHPPHVTARPIDPVAVWADKYVLAGNFLSPPGESRKLVWIRGAQKRIVQKAAAERIEQPVDRHSVRKDTRRFPEAIGRKHDHASRCQPPLGHSPITRQEEAILFDSALNQTAVLFAGSGNFRIVACCSQAAAKPCQHAVAEKSDATWCT